jgi:hypothetical protein
MLMMLADYGDDGTELFQKWNEDTVEIMCIEEK